MSISEIYFDFNKLEFLIEKYEAKSIDDILENEMILICADFYGIQKFIFENLATKNAAKILRAKSAFIQFFTDYLAKYICHKYDIDQKYILSSTAGKIEILSSNINTSILEDIQNKINEYFIDNFFGLAGVNLCYIKCSKDDFLVKEKYKKLRDKVSKKIESTKFKKFNLSSNNYNIMKYDETITSQTLCKKCNMRKIKSNDSCNICNVFIRLGKDLVSNKTSINSKNLNLNIDNFDTDLELDEKIKSYVCKNEKQEILEFSDLAQNSCIELENGVKSLAILKADVDNMGNFIKVTNVTDSFENFDFFSKNIDSFFSLYIPTLMKEKYPNTYTVFAGGDDLFLIGAWNEILGLAKQIQKDFRKFIKEKLSISFGISISKPTIPLSYLANITEELLEDAKGIDKDKNAINIFGKTVKWKEYIAVDKELKSIIDYLEDENLNTTFFYQVLEFCDMSKRLNDALSKQNVFSPYDALWKSKLSYSFNKSVRKKSIDPNKLTILAKNIQNFPESTKIIFNEFIYKRRKENG